ncbi:MaoC/PaaZ C-terminal domain-containing protein [Sulfoacidibacillus thermotolerans]|uniref:Dehydratase n=1 Tax=Sulfoacidibacillus thermotolerans TaxID=1765684 RepID=A0A2U3DBT6_SULT2|nr:MaoC/PaaZ C-terminal domain-containing protein [Sulfoacidibacillus thermotolerans]PWI58749.1 dehydratase [Sulfoacidibacillus thermotolerans]
MKRQITVGQELPPLIKGPISHVDLVKYAGASGDFNPIHTVESFAKEVGLGGVIAHGMLTMAYVGQLLTDFAGNEADLLDFSVRFRAMVRPGDTITCLGTITKVEPVASGLLASIQVSAQTQNGEVAVKGSAVLRFDQGEVDVK